MGIWRVFSVICEVKEYVLECVALLSEGTSHIFKKTCCAVQFFLGIFEVGLIGKHDVL